MVLTEFPIVTEVRLLQPLNAEPPMLVTESGITTEVTTVQLCNALFGMLVTPSGITTWLVQIGVHAVRRSIPRPSGSSTPTTKSVTETQEYKGNDMSAAASHGEGKSLSANGKKITSTKQGG